MDGNVEISSSHIGFLASCWIVMKSIGIFLLFFFISYQVTSSIFGFFGPRNYYDTAISESIMAPIITLGVYLSFRYAIWQFAKEKHTTANEHPIAAGLWRVFWVALLLLGMYEVVFGILMASNNIDIQEKAAFILPVIGSISLISGIWLFVKLKKTKV